jgi:menaquinone-dependent protoporphyrinogen oxidase
MKVLVAAASKHGATHEIVAATNARELRLLAGALDKGKLGFGERAVVMAVRAADGDYRNWDEIDAWADEIAGVLSDPMPIVAQ